MDGREASLGYHSRRRNSERRQPGLVFAEREARSMVTISGSGATTFRCADEATGGSKVSEGARLGLLVLHDHSERGSPTVPRTPLPSIKGDTSGFVSEPA